MAAKTSVLSHQKSHHKRYHSLYTWIWIYENHIKLWIDMSEICDPRSTCSCSQLQLKKQAEKKNSGLHEWDSNPWPCDTDAMLYPLSYQATWMDGQLWVCNIPESGAYIPAYRPSKHWLTSFFFLIYQLQNDNAIVFPYIMLCWPFFFQLVRQLLVKTGQERPCHDRLEWDSTGLLRAHCEDHKFHSCLSAV